MAFRHGSKARLYLNGIDLSSSAKSVKPSGDADTAETTVLSSTAKSYIAGLRDASLSIEGILDGVAAGQDQVLEAALGNQSVNAVALYWPQGVAAVGDPGYGMEAIVTAYEVDSPVDDVTQYSAELQSRSGLERVLAGTPGVQAATGNQTAIDGGASSANGGVGFAMALLATGGTVAPKYQDSADNVTFADIITFASVAAGATGWERKEVAGTVRRYVRAAEVGTAAARQWIAAFKRNP